MNRIYNSLQFWKIPVRNIWRNRRRTFKTMASVLIGTITLLTAGSYINMMFVGLRDQAINKEYAHFQIIRKGYLQADDNSQTLKVPSLQIQKLEEELGKMPEVDAVNQRIIIAGLIGNKDHSTFFSAVAGLPEIEAQMAPTLQKGSLLSEDDPTGILIGKAMADKLGAGIGSELILFFASESGMQEAISVHIRGIYSAIMQEQERIMIYLPIQAAWDLTLDKSAHRLLVFLKSKEAGKMKEVMAKTESIIRENRFDLEIKTWEELAVFYKQIVGMFQGMMLVVGFILLMVIVFNISNTIVMSVHERTREIGTLRAMGSGRGEILRLFVAEGVLIGAFGALAGIIITAIALPVITKMHLSLPPGPGNSSPTPIAFYMTVSNVVWIFIINVLTALLATVSPARQASKSRIVESLRE